MTLADAALLLIVTGTALLALIVDLAATIAWLRGRWRFPGSPP
jgi:hypothetical protein